MIAAMSDRELARMQFRLGMFARRGMPAERAEAFVDRLLERDRDGDDRRACIECKRMERGDRNGPTCSAARAGQLQCTSPRFTPITDLLQRCEAFAWMTP